MFTLVSVTRTVASQLGVGNTRILSRRRRGAVRTPEKDLADATETVPFSMFLFDVVSARLYTISVRLQGGAIPGGSRGGHRPNPERGSGW
jgi:hypothetical protein